MPINQDLIHEISEKHDKICKNPEYYMVRKKRANVAAEKLSHLYSWWLEHPAQRRRLLSADHQERDELLKKARKGLENLNLAWNQLLTYEDPLSESSLILAATNVDPVQNGNYPYFRNSTAHLKDLNYLPPSPGKVKDLVGQVFFKLKNGDLHPVEKAAMAHLYLAAIQPFNDGNKRVGRLMQNRILHDALYVPVIIPSGERHVYIDLLEQGCIGWKENDLIAQRPFFDYIGGKVNNQLDDILGDLKQIRTSGH